jgi:glutaredoxin 3
MYSSAHCPFCFRAKQLLTAKNIQFTDISIDGEPAKRQQMVKRSGRTSVPQIWIDKHHVGGYDDMALLERQGKLDQLLNQAQ